MLSTINRCYPTKLSCRSGSYTYTFLRLSDANYENVKLEGPSIDQVVHPLAAADFVKSTQANGKQVLHSCSGSLVDVDVDLKVRIPWLCLLPTLTKPTILGDTTMEPGNSDLGPQSYQERAYT
jgi:nucleoporin POM152